MKRRRGRAGASPPPGRRRRGSFIAPGPRPVPGPGPRRTSAARTRPGRGGWPGTAAAATSCALLAVLRGLERGRVQQDDDGPDAPGCEASRRGRMNAGSWDAVTMIAVMPRRSRFERGDQGLVERRPPVGLDRGQQLEDLEPLAGAPVGRQDGHPVGVDGEADGAVLADRLVRDGRGGPDRDLSGGPVAGARLERRVQVQEDPGVGGLLEVELLDLDLAQARRAPPVDPVHRVARGVRPHARRERRGLEGPLGRRVRPLDVGRWQAPQRQRRRSAGRRRA